MGHLEKENRGVTVAHVRRDALHQGVPALATSWHKEVRGASTKLKNVEGGNPPPLAMESLLRLEESIALRMLVVGVYPAPACAQGVHAGHFRPACRACPRLHDQNRSVIPKSSGSPGTMGFDNWQGGLTLRDYITCTGGGGAWLRSRAPVTIFQVKCAKRCHSPVHVCSSLAWRLQVVIRSAGQLPPPPPPSKYAYA